ncbi:MAG: lytic murein transglycosylase [Pseudomonadota bacterium]
MLKPLCLGLGLTLTATAALSAVPCGGDFNTFLTGMKDEARARGLPDQAISTFFAGAAQDPKTLRADRAQGIFQKSFTDFARTVISQNRIDNGRRNAERYRSIFDSIEAQYGVSRGVLLAFWALETDYGGFQGDFNTRNSLLTLSHDCRRPELFRPQVFAAIELTARGAFDPARTTGAWAGEIGMVQMLPEDIIHYGQDGDGNGRVELKTSVPDALISGGAMLRGLGWRPNEPWLQEIVVPQGFDVSLSGLQTRKPVSDWASQGIRARQGTLGPANLPAAILLPMGQGGPAFIAYPNFDVFFEWNQSFTYVTTAAYFATRLEGSPVFDPGKPTPGLSGEEMIALQRKLQARGHDVGKVDGILGARTRAAVRAEQARLGMPVDAWPTRALLNQL